MEIWRHLEKLRVQLQLTENQFSLLMGLSVQQYRSQLRLKKAPSAPSVLLLAELLGLRVSEIKDGSYETARLKKGLSATLRRASATLSAHQPKHLRLIKPDERSP